MSLEKNNGITGPNNRKMAIDKTMANEKLINSKYKATKFYLPVFQTHQNWIFISTSLCNQHSVSLIRFHYSCLHRLCCRYIYNENSPLFEYVSANLIICPTNSFKMRSIPSNLNTSITFHKTSWMKIKKFMYGETCKFYRKWQITETKLNVATQN